MNVSRIQLAQWLYEDDRSLGGFPPMTSFDDLREIEKNLYLYSADFLLNQETQTWPKKILNRLKG